MKAFDLKISIDYVSLKVKFPCRISICLKFKAKEYSIIEEQPLLNGNFNAPTREISNLEAEYKQTQDRFVENQSLSIILYLHSSQGKLLVGSFPFKLNDITAKKTIVEKIKNSPDKNAEIKLTLQLIKYKNKIDSLSRIDDIATKYSPKRQTRYLSMKNINSQEEITFHSPPIHKMDNQYGSYFRKQKGNDIAAYKSMNKLDERFLATKPLLVKSNVNCPESLEKFQTSKVTENHSTNSVVNIKRKLTEVKQATQGNQKYLEKIIALEKQLKQAKENISGLELDLRLKQSNSKYLEKDSQTKKEKIQALQSQEKELNKKLMNNQHKIRELQYNFKNLSEQYNELQRLNEVLIKKTEKREDSNKQMLNSLNERYYQIEKEKENLYYKVSSLESRIQDNNKQYNNQLKEKEKRYNEEKALSNKKLNQLQKIIEEKRNEAMNLAQKWKASQKETQVLKDSYEKLTNQNLKLSNRIQELSLFIAKAQAQRKVLQQELIEQRFISQQNKRLKEEIQSKDEEIEASTKKILKLEEAVTEGQEKFKQLKTHVESLQEEYEKLYYDNIGQNEQIERKNKAIKDLMEENEQMEKNIEKLNFSLKKMANEFEEERTQMQQSLKSLKFQQEKITFTLDQTKNELAQQRQRKRIVDKQLLDAKKRIEDLENQLQNVQSQLDNKSQQLNKTKGSNILLTSRIQNITSQLQELKRLKEEKQSKVARLSQQNEAISKKKESEIEQLEQHIEKLQNQIQELKKQNEEMLELVNSKKQQIQDLKQQISLKRVELRELNQIKAEIERNNAAYQQKIIELHEKNEKLQEQIAQLHLQGKEIDACFINNQQHLQTKDQSPVLSHEIRMLKVKDLLQQISMSQKVNEDRKEKIFSQSQQIYTLKDQVSHLKEEISSKLTVIYSSNKGTDQLKKYFDDILQGLKTQLEEKRTEMMGNSIFKMSQEVIDQHKTSIEKYKEIIDQINNKISGIHEEKAKLLTCIQEHQANQAKLNAELKRYKMNEDRLNEQKSEFKKMIKELNQEIQQLGNEKNQMTDSNNQLSIQKKQLEALLRQKQQKIAELLQSSKHQQAKIEEYEALLDRQKQLFDKNEVQSGQRMKQMMKRLQSSKLELTQKSKHFAQVQAQKKNRIQIMTNTIDQLKKQNFDLQSVAYAEKSNNTKLNSILSELTSSINKVQKANNIKTYYMIPIRDLLKKFEHIMSASDKMYVEFQKKNGKKQQKAHEN